MNAGVSLPPVTYLSIYLLFRGYSVQHCWSLSIGRVSVSMPTAFKILCNLYLLDWANCIVNAS